MKKFLSFLSFLSFLAEWRYFNFRGAGYPKPTDWKVESSEIEHFNQSKI